jgi:molecular chaperone GrpE
MKICFMSFSTNAWNEEACAMMMTPSPSPESTPESVLSEETPQPEAPGSMPVSSMPTPQTGPTYAELHALFEEQQQQHLRLAADFDNFRKRRMQELDHQRKYGAEHFLKNFLPVLDNFERARQSVNSETDAATLLKTLELMQQQLQQALNETGLIRCEVLEKPFDPGLHEAVSQLPMPGKASGTIIAEQQAGYMLHDRVLRHAQVIVVNNPEH